MQGLYSNNVPDNPIPEKTCTPCSACRTDGNFLRFFQLDLIATRGALIAARSWGLRTLTEKPVANHGISQGKGKQKGKSPAHHRETAEVDAKEIGDEEGKDRDESSTKTDENHLGLQMDF
jgi:hypothetical protein